MFIIRLLFILTLIALAVSGALYLFTGNRRYLKYVWNVLKAGVVLVAILGVLVVAERLVML
ncbi:hypothetical protein [Sulfuriferula sp.]|uniref:hypothetical protein n=1 Tax=Sulfuriferula sp. TaxID=2025307 RepID=UPI00273076F1|nr:hypothetical protein [Sulfuriferula sp.]MDP2024595.1 hypothetical protein [Sulfuriferula sp.]